MTDPRSIFLAACNTVAGALAGAGFKPTMKGQRLKRLSPDRDVVSEIYFQSSVLNDASHIAVLPHLSIHSKALKPWMVDQTKNPHETGLVYTNHLAHITARGSRLDWELAGASRDAYVSEIASLIQQHALPIFSLFDDREAAARFLTENGTRFNKWCAPSLHPLPFMLRFAAKADAERFFNDWVDACGYEGDVVRLYASLAKAKTIDLRHSEFHHADNVKLAFVNGLKLSQ